MCLGSKAQFVVNFTIHYELFKNKSSPHAALCFTGHLLFSLSTPLLSFRGEDITARLCVCRGKTKTDIFQPFD